ncbi:hypothetical protein J4206_01885 [Candidatus Woesearchaeota archaeon]|nr:hypothetical protein [Candidatus Woesearchaeota archaeon]
MDTEELLLRAMLLLEIAEEESDKTNLKKSIDICSEAIKIDPSPQAYSLLATAMLKLDNKSEAKNNFNHVLRLIQNKPIEQRTKEDYVAAITAENELDKLGINPEKSTSQKFAMQALNRGILTRNRK